MGQAPIRHLRLLGILLALCLLAVVGLRLLLSGRQSAPAAESAPHSPVRPTRLEKTGAGLYASVCAYCHGADGDGFGLNSPNLAVPPRDHTDAAYMNTLGEELLVAIIKFGGASQGKSALMPAWGGRFNDREIAALASYLRSLTRRPGNSR